MKKLIAFVLWALVLLVLPVVSAQNTVFTDLHRIDVLNLFISEKYLSCSKEVYAVVELKNTGESVEHVHLEVINAKLGVDEVAPIFMMPPNKLSSITLPIRLEEEPEGSVEFEVVLHYSNEIRRYFKAFVFEGCQNNPAPVIQTQTSNNGGLPSQQGNQEKPGFQLSGQIIFVTIMVVVVFLLALVYLLKLYIEKITQHR